MRQLVPNTKSYAQQQLLGPEKEQQYSWQPVTAQELYLGLANPIQMGLIGVPLKRYCKEDRVYLGRDGLQPGAYHAETSIYEIHCFFHVSLYKLLTDTPEGLCCWH